MYRNIFILLYVNSLLDIILLIHLNVFVIFPAIYLHYLKRIIGANSTQHCLLISVFWSLRDLRLDFPFASSGEVVCIKSRGDELEKQWNKSKRTFHVYPPGAKVWMPEPLENIQKWSELQLAGGKNDFPLGDSSLSKVHPLLTYWMS